MLEEHKRMRVVVESLKGLISQGNKIIEGGQNLSDVKIEVGVPGGAHADFCGLVDEIKQVNEKHSFGYDSRLESLGNFQVGNWSELVAKCNMLLPIAKQFLYKVEPPLKVAYVGRRPQLK